MIHINNYTISFLFSLGLFFITPSIAQQQALDINFIAPTTKEEKQIKKYMEVVQQAILKDHIPSLSIAILKNQKIIYASALGYQDIENKVPATTATRYSIASLTKPVAATIFMKLSEEKKINLDSKLKDVFQGYTEYFSAVKEEFETKYPELMPYIHNYHFTEYDITIRHHLTHTAEFIPGTRYKYNGFLFGRLVRVIDQLFPQKFTGLMDSLVIQKLGMKQTYLQFKGLDNNQKTILAKPYTFDGTNYVLKNYPDPNTLNPGAGLISTPSDYARFDIAIDKDLLLSPNSKQTMHTPAAGKNGTFPYALGWFINTEKNKHLIYHYGLQETFSSLYIKIPKNNMTLILFANSSGLTAGYDFNTRKGLLKNMYVREFLEQFE